MERTKQIVSEELNKIYEQLANLDKNEFYGFSMKYGRDWYSFYSNEGIENSEDRLKIEDYIKQVLALRKGSLELELKKLLS